MNSDNKKIYRTAALGFVLICFFIGFVSFKYYDSLQSTVTAESSDYMQEISKQISTNVSNTIDDNFAILETIATVLDDTQVNNYDQLHIIVAKYQKYWNYQKIMMVDENGIVYDDMGNTVALSNDKYLQEAIVLQTASMSASQVIDGQECIVFAIPLANIEMNGVEMKAMAGVYNLDTFDQILSMTAFDGHGYAQIIRKDGTVVIRSSSTKSILGGYNLLHALAATEIIDGIDASAVSKAIEEGQSGQIEYSLNNFNEYMTYVPLSNEDWYLLTFVPTNVVNEKSNTLLRITMIICSLITMAFATLFAVLLLTFFRHKRKLEKIAYLDEITGGNTINRFNELANELLTEKHETQQFALVYSNIEKFKVLNDQFGKKACDNILCGIQSGISTDLDKDECMGRLSADNFCVLVKYKNEKEMIERLYRWQNGSAKYIEKMGEAWLPLIIEFGIFVISNRNMPIFNMIDRAKLSLSTANSELKEKVRYAIFDEDVRKVLYREKSLEDRMENALKEGEFEVYLQPKVDTQSECIDGAEALVRWNSKTEGMIFPDEFIPLFEKNGFVIQLDMFVFEEVCKTLRRWIDSGQQIVKISANCSRINLKRPDFLKKYTETAKKYDLPENCIEIELTENTVFENVEALSQIIMDIHDAGFGCSMDDFGSGYSSLNLIQDIPVDTLKLDKIFFRSFAKDMNRTESVVGSIISMSKALSMRTVAEGVEERDVVNMLKRLQCDSIQGYYFGKPMPISEFEELAFKKK